MKVVDAIDRETGQAVASFEELPAVIQLPNGDHICGATMDNLKTHTEARFELRVRDAPDRPKPVLSVQERLDRLERFLQIKE